MEFYPFRDRQVAHGQLVLAYRVGALWGVIAMDGPNRGLVLGHAPAVSLEAVEMVGRDRAPRLTSVKMSQWALIGLWCAYGTYGCTEVLNVLTDGWNVDYADLDREGRVFVK